MSASSIFLRHTVLTAALIALPLADVLAQVMPDAGHSLRDAERAPPPLPPRQRLELNLPDEGATAPLPEGPRLRVRGFDIAGNTALDAAELTALLADLAGRELSLAELREGARRITRRYRERGYPLARAWLPQQEIADGLVRIEVLEGRYGEVRINNPAGLRAAALAPLAALRPGEVVRAGPLERGLLLTRDLAGVEVRSTLQPGASVGTTDLAVDLLPGRFFSGGLEADNFGNRYTGEYRLSGRLEVNNPLGLGDQLSLRLLASDAAQLYGRLAWEGAAGPWGTRFGIGHAQMRYELDKDFAVLDAHGRARIHSAWLRQPLVRGRDVSLFLAIQFDAKRLTDEIDLFASRDEKRSRLWATTLHGNGADDWLGGGLSRAALTWSSGRLDLDDPASRALDAVTTRSAGHFDKFSLSLARLQRLAGPFSLYGQFEGQWARDNLDSSEKFVLGGAYGVRAYPQGEAAGDQGWLAKLELRYALAPAWQLSAFTDHGAVRINRDPWAAGRNERRLSGAGLAVEWTSGGADSGWRAQASAAWKTGDEAATAGPARSPRLWLRLAREF